MQDLWRAIIPNVHWQDERIHQISSNDLVITQKHGLEVREVGTRETETSIAWLEYCRFRPQWRIRYFENSVGRNAILEHTKVEDELDVCVTQVSFDEENISMTLSTWVRDQNRNTGSRQLVHVARAVFVEWSSQPAACWSWNVRFVCMTLTLCRQRFLSKRQTIKKKRTVREMRLKFDQLLALVNHVIGMFRHIVIQLRNTIAAK